MGETINSIDQVLQHHDVHFCQIQHAIRNYLALHIAYGG